MPQRPFQRLMTAFPDNDGYDIHRPSQFLPETTDVKVREMVVELEKIVDVALKIRVPLSGGIAHLVLLVEMLQRRQQTKSQQQELVEYLFLISRFGDLFSERFLVEFERLCVLLSFHDSGTSHPDYQPEPTAPN